MKNESFKVLSIQDRERQRPARRIPSLRGKHRRWSLRSPALCFLLVFFFGAKLAWTADLPTIVQQAYLKASNTGARDSFGHAVAVSGDIMVVGTPFEDSNARGVNGNENNNSATDSGAAYVFVRTGTNWTQQAYLKASNPGAGDYFGFSVAISGESIVVGAPNEDSNARGVDGNQNSNSATDSGAAYVFGATERTGFSRPI